MGKDNILMIENLTVALADGGRILEDVSLAVPAGGITAIVGGSGSGKTTLGLSVLGLLPPSMERTRGRIIFDGVDLALLSPEALRPYRGGRIAMVFQEPLMAFDPLMTIGGQIAETLQAHERISGRERTARVQAALEAAGIGDWKRVFSAYPHELSGGLRQRAMVAQAVVCHPKMLIADEPTSNLDVATQEIVLDLFKGLRRSMGLSILFITHDLAVVRRVADEVAVLTGGCVAEQGAVAAVMASPASAYTKSLLMAEI